MASCKHGALGVVIPQKNLLDSNQVIKPKVVWVVAGQEWQNLGRRLRWTAWLGAFVLLPVRNEAN
jgi:hypothetical protein